MELLQAMRERHSVRSYLDKSIESEKADALQMLIDECNEDGNLHIQLVLNEPKAFDGFMAALRKIFGRAKLRRAYRKNYRRFTRENRLLRGENSFVCPIARSEYLLGCDDL